MYTRSSLILLLFISFAAEVHAQEDYVLTDTVPHYSLGVHLVTSPLANGFEIAYTRDEDDRGKEFSIFFSGTSSQVRRLCAEFTDSTRAAIRVEDRLPYNPDISRYNISARRNNFLAMRYSSLTYNKKRKAAFRSSLGYRLSRWEVETSSKPIFPSGLIFSTSCGAGGSFFDFGPKRERHSETELITSSEKEITHVHTLEAGLGMSFLASPLPRLKIALEFNAFALLPINQARIVIKAPGGLISSNYKLETKQQIAVNFDASIGLLWRIR